MIRIVDLTVSYGASTPLASLNLDLPDGSNAIMGPSGSGKSTLLRVLSGQQEPTQGQILIDETPVQRAGWTTAGDPRIAMIHQDYRLVPFLDVADNLRLAAELRGLPGQVDVVGALGRVGLDDELSTRLPDQISGGQQQRVAIARALVTGASIIVADEPTGALDASNSARIASLLADLARREGLTVVVATHDLSVAQQMDRTIDLGLLLQGAA